MRNEIIIFSFLIFQIYANEEYELSFDLFLSGEIKFDLDLFNKNNENNNKLFYSGRIKNIKQTLNFNDNIKNKVNEKDILIYILNKEYIKYINLFESQTKFVIIKEFIEELKDVYQNYTIFLLDDVQNPEFISYINYLEEQKMYFVKIGKKIGVSMKIKLFIFLFLNISISLTISIIFRKRIKEMEQDNLLPINFLIYIISDILLITNFFNDISYFFIQSKEYFFIGEYITLLMYSFYKSIFYTSMILVLSGWTTISFFGVGERFKKIHKKILYYDLIFSALILFSLYFIMFTAQLNLFYIKNFSEHLSLIYLTIYYIVKKLIPLGRQMNYEQSIRSDLVKCIKFKFRRLFLTNLTIIFYSIFFMNSPLFEKKYIYCYIDNFSIHLTLQLFYENLFILLLAIIFFPKKLPRYYFDEIIFNYRIKVFLLANIYEQENKKKTKTLNISNLSFEKLKKLSKKENYPLVLLNPFTSSKSEILFNEVHLGNVQRYQKDK